jgi:hypothetical protein
MTLLLNTPFNPASLGNLLAWYAADQITSPPGSGSPLAAWNDLSGNGNTASQGTGGDQPSYATNQLNGLPGVAFNGSSDSMASAASFGGSAFTIFAVAAVTSTVANHAIIGASLVGGPELLTNTSAQLQLNAEDSSGIATSTRTVTAGSPSIAVVSYANPGTWVFRLNGTADSNGTSATTTSARSLVLGGNADSGSEFFNGAMYEVLAYTSALTLAQIQNVENYLLQKWLATGPGANYTSTAGPSWLPRKLGPKAVGPTFFAGRIPLLPTPVPTEQASGTGSFLFTGSGIAVPTFAASGNGAFLFTASGNETATVPASGAGLFTFTGSAAATSPVTARLLVRERPPTNLSVSVATPTGPTYRLGADDPNVNNKPDQLTFSTTMPGGFDQCSLTLNRDPRINWPDLIELSTVTAYGLGGSQVAYQGRIEEFPSQAGQQSTFSPTIAGWQNHLLDDQYAAMVFIDRELATWSTPTTSRQITDIGNAQQPSGDLSFQVGADQNNKIALILSGTTPWTGNQIVEAWYGNGAVNLARIQASSILQLNPTYLVRTNSGDNLFVNFASDNSVPTSANGASAISLPQTPFSVVASPVLPYAIVGLVNSGTVSGSPPSGTTVGVAVENLAIMGNHGLTLRTGASGSSPSYDDGYLASDVEGYVLSTWCPKLSYSAGSSGTIQPSSFVIPQLAFPTATTPDVIITAANQFELRDWAVWEATTGTSGPTYYSNTRGARGKTWVARVGPAQLQNAGPQMNRLWNGVVVQWANVDGTTGLVGPPASNAPNTSSSLLDNDPTNPANILGINRWYLLTLGTSTLAGATQVGAVFLQEQALINTSGQAQLVGHVQDSAGNYWPSWMVRAGDTISFIDAADSSSRRVVGTSYAHTSRTNTVQLDAPPDGMTALLDRLSAAISFAGFQ